MMILSLMAATCLQTDEAQEAIQRFLVPDGFTVNLFAAEPMLAHPVAFTFDAFGRLFVAETFRHSQGVTDMRGHMDWLEDDLAIKTVADRVAMFKKHETEEDFIKGYATASERVTRLVDTDGDGVADEATVFAESFNDPAAGIAAGLLAGSLPDGGTELWFTCIPSLWKLIDADGDGVAESKEEHSTGYGLRVALLGHDLHGLVIGPDARLYFSIGDRGFNVTTAEGEKLVRFGTGAVFRCELDGAGLEIFCDGLRNPQELVFDDRGNLFTLDNNSDGGDQARWTWLLEGSDTGWRQAFQWVESPVSRGPWNQELLWKPFTTEQPAYILPPIANFTSGPSGLTMYPGTGWGDRWQDTFFVCDFRGNPGYSGIYSFRNRRDRSGFELIETEKFLWDILPTDVEFGLDGALYWSDWVTGWNRTGKGRIYRTVPTTVTEADALMVGQVAQIVRIPRKDLSDAQIAMWLTHPDRRVRMHVQLAAVERLQVGSVQLSEQLHRMAGNENTPLRGRLHSIWALRAGGRLKGPNADGSLRYARIAALKDSPSPEVVAEAAHAMAVDARDTSDDETRAGIQANLEALLGHGDAPVRLAAAQSMGESGLEGGVAALIGLLTRDGATDPWIRHAVIRALEQLSPDGVAFEVEGDAPEHVRRAMVVLARRMGDAKGLEKALSKPSETLVYEEAIRAIYDAPVPGAMEALGGELSKLALQPNELTTRRALYANRQVATEAAAARIADFVVSDASGALRAEALKVLMHWQDPMTRDGILLDHRPLPGGAPLSTAITEGHGISSPEFVKSNVPAARSPELERAVVGWHRSLGDGAQAQQLESMLALALRKEADTQARIAAFELLLERFKDEPRVQALVEGTIHGPASFHPLRAVAITSLADEDAAKVLKQLARSQNQSDSREAVRVLGELRTPLCEDAFAEVGASLAGDSPLLVEWLMAAKGHPSAAVAAAEATQAAAWAASGDALAPWRMCLTGGDAAAGLKVFKTKSETSCMKCHIVGSEGGSEAGPAMDAVGSRLTSEELLGSIVEPNAAIAKGYETWILALEDGEVLSGRILEESDEVVVLETNKKETFDLDPAEITGRRRDVTAMPSDVSSHLSRTEMRDLIAFLASLRE